MVDLLEIIGGLLGAVLAWLFMEVVVGGLVGELLSKPIRVLFGPPLGKYVVVLSWSAVVVFGVIGRDRMPWDWTRSAFWAGFFAAGVFSAFALVQYKEAEEDTVSPDVLDDSPDVSVRNTLNPLAPPRKRIR